MEMEISRAKPLSFASYQRTRDIDLVEGKEGKVNLEKFIEFSVRLDQCQICLKLRVRVCGLLRKFTRN